MGSGGWMVTAALSGDLPNGNIFDTKKYLFLKMKEGFTFLKTSGR